MGAIGTVWTWRSMAAGLCALVAAGAAAAQPAAFDRGGGDGGLRALSDRFVGAGLQQGGAPRAVVAISRHGRRSFFGYSGAGEAAIAAGTVVEIGSITKVFTGTLLAEAIERRQVDPNRSIQAYLPGVQLGRCTAQITPIELSDMSSGLPELPGDAASRALAQRGIDQYTSQDFLTWLARTPPRTGCNLPAPYLYSNAAVGVLGYVLANATGRNWRQLVGQEIIGPLGMVNTAAGPQPSQIEGHLANGQIAPQWPVFAWFSAGALRSTPQDMLSFGEAALGHPSVNGRHVPPALTRAFDNAMRPIYQHDAFNSVGLSWESQADGSGGTVAYKLGGTAGFNSLVLVDQAQDTTIFIVANKVGLPLTGMGLRLMKALAAQGGG